MVEGWNGAVVSNQRLSVMREKKIINYTLTFTETNRSECKYTRSTGGFLQLLLFHYVTE